MLLNAVYHSCLYIYSPSGPVPESSLCMFVMLQVVQLWASHRGQIGLSCVCWPLKRNSLVDVGFVLLYEHTTLGMDRCSKEADNLALGADYAKKGKGSSVALAVWCADKAYVFSLQSCCPLHAALIKCNEAHLKALIIFRYIIKPQLFVNNASVCVWGQHSMQVL